MILEQPPRSILDNTEALVDFFNGALERATSFAQHFDTQINILVGISTAVGAIAINGLREGQEFFSFLILGAFSALSVIFGLYAIYPPRFMRKQHQDESIFYNKHVIEHASADEYAKVVKNSLGSQDQLVSEYSTEMYNLFRYYYRPKRVLFRYSRNFLMVGIIISAITYYCEHLIIQ